MGGEHRCGRRARRAARRGGDAVRPGAPDRRWRHGAGGRRPASSVIVVDLARRYGLPVRAIGLSVDEIAAAATESALAVATVPAGAADHLAGALARVPALFDVIYHPWPTPLAAAGAAGRITVTGLDMLLHQALRQFELVTGVRAPADAMRAALRKAVETDLALPV